MNTTEQRAAARPERFQDELIRPFLALVMIAGTIARWPYSAILYPQVALPLFILVSIAAVGTLLPWTRLSGGQQLAAMTATMLLASLLLPLAHQTTTAALFPYVAASSAGGKLASRRAAIGVAVAGALVAAGATWLAGLLAPTVSQWPLWVTLTIALPVYIGISNRDRRDALRSAQLAAEEAQRATASEAREAALLERGRIAREIHDVLGHSLSGIALQLDMADALRDSGARRSRPRPFAEPGRSPWTASARPGGPCTRCARTPCHCRTPCTNSPNTARSTSRSPARRAPSAPRSRTPLSGRRRRH
jgi:signal transduction histidine kinase